jgi:hypothetical protein
VGVEPRSLQTSLTLVLEHVDRVHWARSGLHPKATRINLEAMFRARDVDDLI